MKVRFISGPKINTTEHVANDIGRTLVAAGLAEHIPYKDFRERLAAETHASESVAVEWGIHESDGSAFSKNAVIKKVGSATTFYSAPPDDAPASIKRRFAELTTRDPNASAVSIAEAKRSQAEYEEKSKHFKRY